MSGKFEPGALVQVRDLGDKVMIPPPGLCGALVSKTVGLAVAATGEPVDGWLVDFGKSVPCVRGHNGTTPHRSRYVNVTTVRLRVISPPGNSLTKEDETPAKAHRPVHAGFPQPEKV